MLTFTEQHLNISQCKSIPPTFQTKEMNKRSISWIYVRLFTFFCLKCKVLSTAILLFSFKKNQLWRLRGTCHLQTRQTGAKEQSQLGVSEGGWGCWRGEKGESSTENTGTIINNSVSVCAKDNDLFDSSNTMVVKVRCLGGCINWNVIHIKKYDEWSSLLNEQVIWQITCLQKKAL